MELFDGVSASEKHLLMKADAYNIPIGGTMELLPLCNMNCKMCYIRQTQEEMSSQGRMLSCDEWLEIAQSAKEAGVLFWLITGGEPLIYPEFKRLYTELMNMGFVITINTNGTLIDEEWADFFAKLPCRRMNITLYGKDNNTYQQLCNNPNGFTQVCRATKLLKERNISFRYTFTCTPDNLDQLPELYDFSRKQNIPLAYCSYVFPPQRKGNATDSFVRLSPQRCGESFIIGAHAKNPHIPMDVFAKVTLAQLKQPIRNYAAGYTCRAGKSGFWINWKGELLPCGMFNEPNVSLLEYSFSEAWKKISKAFCNHAICNECETCKLRNACRVCPAACYTETGRTDGKPQYLCDATKEMVRLTLEYLSPEEQSEYIDFLKNQTW